MYFSARKSGAAPFVGPLDALIAQGATLRHASSVRRLLSNYTGPACRLTESGFGSEADFSFLADGTLDINAINIFTDIALNGENGPFQVTWQTAYDQSGWYNNATQTNQSLQPIFATGVEAKGAMQGTGSLRTLNVDLNNNFQPDIRPFFVLAVVNIANLSASSRVLLGTSSSATLQIRQSFNSIHSAWGTTLQSTDAVPGKQTLGFLVDGVNSANYRNGVVQTTGNSGTTNLNLAFSRIGRSSVSTTSWFHTVNNTISEFIVFNGNPTTLPGWPAFVAAQKAYFGIV